MNRREEFAVRIFAGILASDDGGDVSFDFARKHAIEQADKLIQDLDSMTTEGWITGRDPVKEGWYLATRMHMMGKRTTETLYYKDGNWPFTVIAWMPKPKPFGG